MKKRYLFAASLAAAMLTLNSCSDFLNTKPDTILTQDQTYGDPTLIKSVIANFYGRTMLGQKVEDWDAWTSIDEAIYYDRNETEYFDRNKWCDYDHCYDLIHDLNVFLEGVKTSTAIDDATKEAYIGEVRYIRAWIYFCLGRSLGGVPIVGDQIFDYTPGMDISTMQIPRSTETALYDYIISECQEAGKLLTTETNTHNARANYWVAKMLEARAALTAASLARYNTPEAHPQLRTQGGEVGIPAEKAEGYYQTALAAAKEVIEKGPYKLMYPTENTPQAYADNFYKAVCQKDGNTEVIWCFDFVAPGKTHQFTTNNLPKSIAQDTGCDRLSVILGLVEAFEPIDASEEERGKGARFDIGTIDNPKFFDNPTDLFMERDPRLNGSIIFPGATFGGQTIELQAGQLRKENGKWVERTGARNSYDEEHRLITANNGPFGGNEREINRTGFYVRKYLDATPAAGTIGRGSDMWNVHFRIAEAYLIAAEASWELSGDNYDETALKYINDIRSRAGVKPLTSIDHEKIMHENRVEFAFEGQRWWQLKRWMEADKIWDGNPNTRTAQRLGLWPYKVVAPGDPNDGKWVFIKQQVNTEPYPRYFQMKNYYNFVDLTWVNNNPKFVKNPYQ